MSMEIPSEDEIHRIYNEHQQTREQKMRAWVNSPAPDPFNSRQSYQSATVRYQRPSFQSRFFNVGEGLMTLEPGETKVLAKKTVPSQHAGMLTGFSQFFGSASDGDSEFKNSILWGLRINGLVPVDFQDFIGEFSSLSMPHAVEFILSGGATILGSVSVSPGSSAGTLDDLPTVLLQATNYHTTSVVLQGRLEGYTFPVAEKNDEFANI